MRKCVPTPYSLPKLFFQFYLYTGYNIFLAISPTPSKRENFNSPFMWPAYFACDSRAKGKNIQIVQYLLIKRRIAPLENIEK